jgi:Arc/MetJ family transcription regulator
MKRTNVVLDEDLINEGLSLTGLPSQKALIDLALRELVKRKKRKGILRHFGKVKWDGNLEEMRTLR